MKIIIAGDGKVGLALTEQLLEEEHELVVIDSNPRVLQSSLDQFDVMTVQGNGAAMETLRQAAIDEADLLNAATSADEINLLCCLTAGEILTAFGKFILVATIALHNVLMKLCIPGCHNHFEVFNGGIPHLDVISNGVLKDDDILINDS